MGKTMSEDEGTCATQVLMQMGDGPWLVKMGAYEWDVLMRLNTGRPSPGGALELIAARGTAPRIPAWSTPGNSFTLKRVADIPPDFGGAGKLLVLRHLPGVPLNPAPAQGDVLEWVVDGVVVARRTVVSNVPYVQYDNNNNTVDFSTEQTVNVRTATTAPTNWNSGWRKEEIAH